jgi:hypothetical protein
VLPESSACPGAAFQKATYRRSNRRVTALARSIQAARRVSPGSTKPFGTRTIRCRLSSYPSSCRNSRSPMAETRRKRGLSLDVATSYPYQVLLHFTELRDERLVLSVLFTGLHDRLDQTDAGAELVQDPQGFENRVGLGQSLSAVLHRIAVVPLLCRNPHGVLFLKSPGRADTPLLRPQTVRLPARFEGSSRGRACRPSRTAPFSPSFSHTRRRACPRRSPPPSRHR